jgi:hypothetical protein
MKKALIIFFTNFIMKEKKIYFSHDHNIYEYNGSSDDFKKNIINIANNNLDKLKTKIKDRCAVVDFIFNLMIKNSETKVTLNIEKSESALEKGGANLEKKHKSHLDKKNQDDLVKHYVAKQISTHDLKKNGFCSEKENIEKCIIPFDKIEFEYEKITDINFNSKENIICDDKKITHNKSNGLCGLFL